MFFMLFARDKEDVLKFDLNKHNQCRLNVKDGIKTFEICMKEDEIFDVFCM